MMDAAAAVVSLVPPVAADESFSSVPTDVDVDIDETTHNSLVPVVSVSLLYSSQLVPHSNDEKSDVAAVDATTTGELLLPCVSSPCHYQVVRQQRV